MTSRFKNIQIPPPHLFAKNSIPYAEPLKFQTSTKFHAIQLEKTNTKTGTLPPPLSNKSKTLEIISSPGQRPPLFAASPADDANRASRDDVNRRNSPLSWWKLSRRWCLGVDHGVGRKGCVSHDISRSAPKANCCFMHARCERGADEAAAAADGCAQSEREGDGPVSVREREKRREIEMLPPPLTSGPERVGRPPTRRRCDALPSASLALAVPSNFVIFSSGGESEGWIF